MSSASHSGSREGSKVPADETQKGKNLWLLLWIQPLKRAVGHWSVLK